MMTLSVRCVGSTSVCTQLPGIPLSRLKVLVRVATLLSDGLWWMLTKGWHFFISQVWQCPSASSSGHKRSQFELLAELEHDSGVSGEAEVWLLGLFNDANMKTLLSWFGRVDTPPTKKLKT